MLIKLWKQFKCFLITGGNHKWKYDRDNHGDKYVVAWYFAHSHDKKCSTRQTCAICGYREVSIAVDTWGDGIKFGWIDSKHQPLTREKILQYGKY